MLFRIDVYFTEYLLAVEIGGKIDASGDLVFEEKRKEALEKKLNCEFIIELIRVSVMMKIMKLVEQKQLLVNLKIEN